MRKVLLSIVLMFVLAACGRVDFRQDDQYSYLTITLTSEEVTGFVERLLTEGATPLMRSASAELREGEIFVTGDVNDGRGGVVGGTLSIRMSAQDGVLDAAVTQLNFAGYTADQNALARINSDIAAGLAASARNNNSGSDISAIDITPVGLSITFRSVRQPS
ncbi:MAG: hypothetical protein KME04_19360 [Pleurocapsa minor GSE-CHR-MK-17-07R]|jgi:hypothetical protein|nr:hypothetical protein [Pleurocapsa minor GSE-CHR-MK 17-07R]